MRFASLLVSRPQHRPKGKSRLSTLSHRRPQMNSRKLLWTASAILALLALTAVVWLFMAPSPSTKVTLRGAKTTGSNPSLDVRYVYNPKVFTPGNYDPNAE